MDNFTNVPFTRRNLDRYVVRTAILRALKEMSHVMTGNLLDAGCGKMPYKTFLLSHGRLSAYTGLDIDSAMVYDKEVQPDYTWDGVQMPFDSNTFQCVMATEVMEHCPEPAIFLKEVFRVLKPGGHYCFTVPFLWNLHEVPHDEFRYTPFALQRLLSNAAFVDISIKPMGGWHASMAQLLGLWIRRSPMNAYTRRILSVFIKPTMRWLLRKDAKVKVDFNEGVMITGLYGYASKPVNKEENEASNRH